MKAGTIFITGISASGKSTLGKRLKEAMLDSGITDVRLIDGEDTRRQLLAQGKSYGYSPEERKKLALEMARMAFEYNKEGIVCIICSICHVSRVREEMHAIIGNIFEVYLDCPIEICAKRDYKEQYSKAFKGLLDNFIGITEPYQRSDKARLILHTGDDSIERCSQLLFESALTFLRGEYIKPEEDLAMKR